MTSTLRTYLSIAALVALPVLDGCSNSSSTSTSNLRLVNATTDYPSGLDLYSSTTAVSTGVASFAAGTYGGADSGTQTLTLRPAGSGTAASTGSYALAGGTSYSVVAYIDAGSQLKGALLADSETAPSAGAAKFRIFNTISYTPTGSTTTNDLLDAYVTTTACSALAASSIAATASNVKALGAYAEVTAAAAGTAYNVCITGSGDRNDLRLALSGVTLKDQQITTLVLTTTPGGVLVNGVQVDQAGSVTSRANSTARLRVVAGAAARGTVSVSVNGQAIASQLASPVIGAYALVPAGTIAPTVQINGTAVTAASQTAAPGSDWTLLVAGTQSAPRLAYIADNNRPSTASASPVKLRLVNGINGLNNGITLLDNFLPVATNVTFGAPRRRPPWRRPPAR